MTQEDGGQVVSARTLESPEDQARHIRWLASNCDVFAENVVPTYREPFAAVAIGKETGDWLLGEDSNLQPFG
jgi:hypothetical protein